MKGTLKFILALAAVCFGLFCGIALAAVDPGGGSDWIGKLIGFVILAAILYFAYTRIKASKERKEARRAAAGFPPKPGPPPV